ncbi:MAG: VWA domain-containing protein [Bacteroidota bacterium]
MFIPFFLELRKYGIKTSIKEYLHLMEALKKGLCASDLEEFYYLSRTVLVKHEGQFDAYDVLFGQYFQGKEGMKQDFWDQVPEEWLRAELSKIINPEDLEAIEAMGGLDALIERFKMLMDEQEEAHQGGNTFIGGGGTSPFGRDGFNPEGFRMGQKKNNRRNAIKVWDKRQYANLNDKMELNTRNIKMLLRRLRELTREGIADELDINGTIRSTSDNAGYLDIKMRPSRKNKIKVLLLLDIGGSMDDHVELCSRLFTAARHEFKHLAYYYFHNCLYESVWKDNRRRFSERIPTWELINKYNKDYKLIFVGDAAMSPIEISHKGGSVEHWNEEPGMLWLMRMKDHFPNLVWINPNPEYHWPYFKSTEVIRKFTDMRMFPMTLEGIQLAMKSLKDPRITFGDEHDARSYQ